MASRTVTDELFGLAGSEEQHAAPGQDEHNRTRRRDFDAAFALREDIERTTLGQASELYKEEGRTLRRKIIGCAIVFVVLFLFSLCIQSTLGWGLTSPLVIADGIWEHVRVAVGYLMGSPENISYLQMVEAHPGYYQVEARLAGSFVTATCGMVLALAGSLYQMVFKNPIAAPTMLGVSNGVSLGVVIFVMVFQYAALNMVGMRYVFSFVGAGLVLGIVLFLTRLICGRGRSFSIFELLLVGSLFSQLCGAVVQAITDNVMTDELWDVYQSLSEAVGANTGGVEVAIAIGMIVFTVVPVFMMRYAINTVGYSDLEARLIGLDTNKLKAACLIIGTIMVTAAQAIGGTVSMIALVVPFVSRALFGTEFKRQFWGDMLIGATVLLLCKDIVLLLPFFGMELTLGSVVSFITLPIYVWIIVSRQRGWK